MTGRCVLCHKALSKNGFLLCKRCDTENDNLRVWKGMPTRFAEQQPPLQKNIPQKPTPMKTKKITDKKKQRGQMKLVELSTADRRVKK